jgi:hypothetical protein
MRLREALEADALFGRAFAGESWAPWRAVASALDGLPLEDAELALWQQCTGRSEPPTEPATELWCICGRRAGKSRLAASIATHAAVTLDPALLAPGETAVSLIVAVDQKQATVVLNYCAGLLEASPLLRKLIVRRTSDSIELANNCRIEVKSSNFRSVRGLTLACVVVDEICFLRDETSATPDVELIRAVRPGLATTGGAARLYLVAVGETRRHVGPLSEALREGWPGYRVAGAVAGHASGAGCRANRRGARR